MSEPLIDASVPDAVAALMQDMGFKAAVGVDSIGDPLINSAAQGYKFTVFFYDCTDHVDCQAIQFSASFDMTDGMSLIKAEQFNRDKRWAKVYLNDQSDPVLEMDLNLRGGVSVENFNDTFDWWTIVMDEFIQYINF